MILLSARGYITVHAYTSYAYLPVKDVAITVTAPDGTAIAMRLTDRSGQIAPIEIPVPERIYSQSPNPVERPYATVNLYARAKGFEQIENENLQVFPETVTQLELQMIPLSELPDAWDKVSIFDTPAQNL